MEIKSLSNEKIVEYAKLSEAKYRNKTGLFLVEGEKALEDVLKEKIEIKEVFSTEKSLELVKEFTKITEEVAKKLASSKSAPKIVTVAVQKKRDISELKNFSKIVMLEGISDPGNLGTIIRSAVAFGFEAIVLAGNCTDMYNPKVIRSAAGNFFKLPIFKVDALDHEIFENFTFVLTDLHAKNSVAPDKLNLKGKFILALGSEAKGLQIDFSKFDTVNTLLETQKVESLNLAVSASLLMYELRNA